MSWVWSRSLPSATRGRFSLVSAGLTTLRALHSCHLQYSTRLHLYKDRPGNATSRSFKRRSAVTSSRTLVLCPCSSDVRSCAEFLIFVCTSHTRVCRSPASDVEGPWPLGSASVVVQTRQVRMEGISRPQSGPLFDLVSILSIWSCDTISSPAGMPPHVKSTALLMPNICVTTIMRRR